MTFCLTNVWQFVIYANIFKKKRLERLGELGMVGESGVPLSVRRGRHRCCGSKRNSRLECGCCVKGSTYENQLERSGSALNKLAESNPTSGTPTSVEGGMKRWGELGGGMTTGTMRESEWHKHRKHMQPRPKGACIGLQMLEVRRACEPTEHLFTAVQELGEGLECKKVHECIGSKFLICEQYASTLQRVINRIQNTQIFLKNSK